MFQVIPCCMLNLLALRHNRLEEALAVLQAPVQLFGPLGLERALGVSGTCQEGQKMYATQQLLRLLWGQGVNLHPCADLHARLGLSSTPGR